MNIWFWISLLVVSGLLLVILIPEFIHELKWRRKKK